MENEQLKIRVTDIIGSLFYEPQWLKLLKGNGKPYQKLLSFLENDYDFLHLQDNDVDSNKRNTVKRYASDIGCPAAHVNSWLRQIYDDLFDLNQKSPELFVAPGEIPCMLFYSNEPYFFQFTIGFQSVPQPFDSIYFGFASAKTEWGHFVVKEVEYDHSNGKSIVILYLGDYSYDSNRYRSLLIDKAKFLELLKGEERMAERFKMDKLLWQRFHNAEDYI